MVFHLHRGVQQLLICLRQDLQEDFAPLRRWFVDLSRTAMPLVLTARFDVLTENDALTRGEEKL